MAKESIDLRQKMAENASPSKELEKLTENLLNINYEIDIEDFQTFSLEEPPVDLKTIQKDFDLNLNDIELLDPQNKELSFIKSFNIVINDGEINIDNDDSLSRLLKYTINLELDVKHLNKIIIYLNENLFLGSYSETAWLEIKQDERKNIIGGLINILINGTTDAPDVYSSFEESDFSFTVVENLTKNYDVDGFKTNVKFSYE